MKVVKKKEQKLYEFFSKYFTREDERGKAVTFKCEYIIVFIEKPILIVEKQNSAVYVQQNTFQSKSPMQSSIVASLFFFFKY